MKARLCGIGFFALALFTAEAVLASAPLHVPLATMISRAKAIAVGRIAEIKVLETSPITVWQPNRLVTLKIEKTWRGQLPQTVKTKVEISKWDNASADVGDQILLFVGQMVPWEHPMLKDEVDVFEAAQGFIPLDELKPEMLEAIRKSVAAYKQPEKIKSGGGWDPVLNNEAAKPILNLLDSSNADLRYWAIATGFDCVHLTPAIADSLIAALKDPSLQVSRAAAYRLRMKHYQPAFEPLRKFAARDEDSAAVIHAYLQGRAIKAALKDLSAEVKQDLAELLPENRTSRTLTESLTFEVSKDGKLKPELPQPVRLSQRLSEELQKLDWQSMKQLPFEFRIHLWKDNGKAAFDVIVTSPL